MVESYRNRNPGISDEDAARLVVGSMTVFDGLRKHARKLVARVTREHENQELERGMNADLERRAKVPEDPPEAKG